MAQRRGATGGWSGRRCQLGPPARPPPRRTKDPVADDDTPDEITADEVEGDVEGDVDVEVDDDEDVAVDPLEADDDLVDSVVDVDAWPMSTPPIPTSLTATVSTDRGVGSGLSLAVGNSLREGRLPQIIAGPELGCLPVTDEGGRP